MVNKVMSRYNSSPPKDILNGKDERLISSGPLYPDILSVLDNCSIIPSTEKCISDFQLYDITTDDVRKWVKQAIRSGGYINSMWCCAGLKKPGFIVACDAYQVSGFVRDSITMKMIDKEIYLKFCVSKTGNTILQISMHPSTYNN